MATYSITLEPPAGAKNAVTGQPVKPLVLAPANPRDKQDDREKAIVRAKAAIAGEQPGTAAVVREFASSKSRGKRIFTATVERDRRITYAEI